MRPELHSCLLYDAERSLLEIVKFLVIFLTSFVYIC